MIKFDLSTVASHLAIILNASLIWLIWKKSGQPLANYRKILYLGAVYDFWYSIVCVFCGSTVIVTAEYYFIIFEGWSTCFGKWVEFGIQILMVYLSYASMTLITVQFIYRFFLIICDIPLGPKLFVALVLLSLTFPGYILVSWSQFFWPKENQTEIYGPSLIASGQVKPGFSASFIVADRADPYSTEIYLNSLSLTSFAIMLLCSIAIVLKLWHHQNKFPLADRKMQHQITIILSCEALVPLFTLTLPTMMIASLSSVFPWFPTIFTYFISFSPLFNPVIKMFVIYPFRRAIWGIFIRRNQLKTPMITITSMSGSR